MVMLLEVDVILCVGKSTKSVPSLGWARSMDCKFFARETVRLGRVKIGSLKLYVRETPLPEVGVFIIVV